MAAPEGDPAPTIPSEGKTPRPPNPPIDDDIKAQKMARLQARIEALRAEIAAKSEKLEAVSGELKSPPAQTVKTHIALLHSYNEIRDVGQGLLGMIAENRNVRVRDLYAEGEFGVGVKD